MQDYIAQLMFNSPPGLSDAMDLAKMLAVLEMIRPLESPDFRIWRETRTGLLSYPLEIAAARAHLAASIYVQMALKPHIVHIVGHTEADHAATAEDILEAGRMARRVIENALAGQPDMTADPSIQARKQELIQEAQLTLEAIRSLSGSDRRRSFYRPENPDTRRKNRHSGRSSSQKQSLRTGECSNPHPERCLCTGSFGWKANDGGRPAFPHSIDRVKKEKNMSFPENYTVIGAGHGGKAMAAHLALMGKRVTLFNRTYTNIQMMAARGGIELESYEHGPRGFGALEKVTSEMSEALAEAQVIMVVVPSSAHADIAEKCAPHLKDGQISHP